jgi:DNA-binding LacI/PurR family transcriptional regulator
MNSINTPIELRKSIDIALITKHYTGEFFASLFEGFDESTKGTNASISLISVSHRPSSPAQIVSQFKNHFDAAVIFLPDYTATEYLAMLENVPAEFPIVSIAPIINPVVDTVTFDNYRGGYLVADHFHKRGYKNVGIIQGPMSKSEAMLRKSGFLDFIQTSDQMNLVWEFNGDYSFEKGKEAYEYYTRSEMKPDAIFCSNDGMTLGFLHSAIRDGVHVPDEVALAGFDDLPTCELYTPTITSVHTSYELLGKKAIEIILDRLEGKKPSAHSGYMGLVPVSLSVRESSTQLTDKFQNHFKSI